MYKITAYAMAAISSMITAYSLAESSPPFTKVNIHNDLEEIVIHGRASQQIGTANAASEGSVGGADLTIRPLLQVAELLEVIPGMVAVQHSGSGKANQYFLRGFNLDHGTDFTNSVDGVPFNMPSYGHGAGRCHPTLVTTNK